jgi:hypothetical protein
MPGVSAAAEPAGEIVTETPESPPVDAPAAPAIGPIGPQVDLAARVKALVDEL